MASKKKKKVVVKAKKKAPEAKKSAKKEVTRKTAKRAKKTARSKGALALAFKQLPAGRSELSLGGRSIFCGQGNGTTTIAVSGRLCRHLKPTR